MNELAVIGQPEVTIDYIIRPTVKVIIRKTDKVLILNDGLLPGGGVNPGETHAQAIQRELLEELGVTVDDPKGTGCIIQYRNFLAKRYEVYGYVANARDFNIQAIAPQDAGEAMFEPRWMSKSDAISHIKRSIEFHKENEPVLDNDAKQGRLYNLMTSLILLQNIQDAV